MSAGVFNTKGGILLPELEAIWTPAKSSRQGASVRMVVMHTWGVAAWRSERAQGVVNYFMNPANEVSAHLIYAGEAGPDPGRCIQMVRLADKAWTEASFNRVAVSVECSDRIWNGNDPVGLHRAARICGWLLQHYGLPPLYLSGASVLQGKGFTRHGELGENGGGHLNCPTPAGAPTWQRFCQLVAAEHKRGEYRRAWAV